MRSTPVLLLTLVATIAAMGAAASTAAATNKSGTSPDLEVRNADGVGELHCPAVTISGTDVNGGCLGHSVSESSGTELRKHVFGIESHITRCVSEAHGRVDEHGEGYGLEILLISPPIGSCTRQACKDTNSEVIPWKGHAYEGMPETNNGTEEGSEYGETNFCIEPVGGGTDETCEMEGPFQLVQGVPNGGEAGHSTELVGHGVSGFRCEIVGHAKSERGGMHDGENETGVTVSHVNEPD